MQAILYKSDIDSAEEEEEEKEEEEEIADISHCRSSCSASTILRPKSKEPKRKGLQCQSSSQKVQTETLARFGFRGGIQVSLSPQGQATTDLQRDLLRFENSLAWLILFSGFVFSKAEEDILKSGRGGHARMQRG